MILVADSGSTHSDWVIVNHQKESISFNTKGLNPYFTNSSEITDELKNNFPEKIDPKDIKTIYFYGAGCSSDTLKTIILNGLKQFFKTALIHIEHDLLAAARALFFNEKGIAIILGTGSNTCYYDGNKIVNNITSLGYIMGDEGGGDYLGKLFIGDFLNDELPDFVHQSFEKHFQLSKNQILYKIYKEPFPNRFLASFCEFINTMVENEYIDQLIKKSFRDLFIKHICKYNNYSNYKIRVTGSIGFHFQEQLKTVAQEFKSKIDLIEKAPIQRLVSYHIQSI